MLAELQNIEPSAEWVGQRPVRHSHGECRGVAAGVAEAQDCVSGGSRDKYVADVLVGGTVAAGHGLVLFDGSSTRVEPQVKLTAWGGTRLPANLVRTNVGQNEAAKAIATEASDRARVWSVFWKEYGGTGSDRSRVVGRSDEIERGKA
jgi:hypothetical protein